MGKSPGDTTILSSPKLKSLKWVTPLTLGLRKKRSLPSPPIKIGSCTPSSTFNSLSPESPTASDVGAKANSSSTLTASSTSSTTGSWEMTKVADWYSESIVYPESAVNNFSCSKS